MVLYAKDIVETEFISMPPDRSLLDAAKAMAARRHGFVIVMSPEGTPIGIVTEWDILAKVVAVGRNPSEIRLQDIMTRTLVSVDANEGIDQVAKLMAQDGTRRVLVTKEGKMLGVITASHLHHAIAKETPFATAVELGGDDSGLRGREAEVDRVADIEFHCRDRHWSTALPVWAGTFGRSGPTRSVWFNRFMRRRHAMSIPVRSGINLASPIRHA